MQIQWNFFSLIFTVLFISLCDKYCKSWRGDFPRVRPIGFQQFLLLGFFLLLLFIFFARTAAVVLYTERFFSLLQLYKLENNIFGYNNTHFKDWLMRKFYFSQ